MKHLFTLLLFALSFSAIAQADSTKTKPVAGDTIRIDLIQHGAYDKLMGIYQGRMEVQAQALVLQERTKGLDTQQKDILDSEYRHDKRYDPKRTVLSHAIVGTSLVVVVEKLPAPVVVEDKKKKQK